MVQRPPIQGDLTLENYRLGRGVILTLPLSTAFAAGAPILFV
jgi:hypothetical protein